MLTRSRLPAALGAAALLLVGCAKAPDAQAPPPTAVDTLIVQPVALPLDLSYSARAAGAREVEVRARVSGILLKRLYEEGSRVREGEVLFRIDPAPFAAVLDQAKAQFNVAEAALDEARRDYERISPLAGQGLVSQRDSDIATGTYERARANVESARAALRTAQLDVAWTTVRAPISGVTSREVRSEGSLVIAGTESSLLTRIAQADPLHVEFAVIEEEATLLRGALARGQQVAVDVQPEGSNLPLEARLAFVDTFIDGGSGTVMARAILPNPEGAITPGQFVRASVQGIALTPRIVIPSRAVLRSAQGTAVWTVDAEGKAEMRPVTLGRTSGNLVAVAQGLAAGERVVVNGVSKLGPGAPLATSDLSFEQASSALPAPASTTAAASPP